MSSSPNIQWRAPKRASSELIERQIERHLAQEILEGNVPAGTRLPPTRTLAALWSTSCSSVQKAVANLRAAGLVERATSRGTYVRSRTDRALIGILIGPSLIESTSWFYRTLAEQIRVLIDSEYFSSRIYAGLTQHGNELAPQVHSLELDRRYYTFSGYVEISTTNIPEGARDTTRPRVIHSSQAGESDIVYDHDHAAAEIASALTQQGVKRSWVVSLHEPGKSGHRKHRIEAMVGAIACGTGTWARLVNVEIDPLGLHVEERVHDTLMMELASCGPGELPEAIVVSDDVAMRSVILVLLKRGIRIPDEMKLIVLTAECANVYYSVPLMRFCFPTKSTAERLFKLLQERMAGGEQIATPICLRGWMES